MLGLLIIVAPPLLLVAVGVEILRISARVSREGLNTAHFETA